MTEESESLKIKFPLYWNLNDTILANLVGNNSNQNLLPIKVYLQRFTDNNSIDIVQGVSIEYPRESYNLELFWKEGIFGRNCQSTETTIQSFENLNPISLFWCIKEELLKVGLKFTTIAETTVPSFLNDLYFIETTGIFLFPVICYCCDETELVGIITALCISNYCPIYFQSILTTSPGIQKIIIETIFLTLNDKFNNDNAIYWRFRQLCCSLSSKDRNIALCFRDILLEYQMFSELCIDLSIVFLNDSIEIIDQLIEESNDWILTNTSPKTFHSIISVILNSFHTIIIDNNSSQTEKTTKLFQSARVFAITSQYLILNSNANKFNNNTLIESIQILQTLETNIEIILNLDLNNNYELKSQILRISYTLCVIKLVIILSKDNDLKNNTLFHCNNEINRTIILLEEITKQFNEIKINNNLFINNRNFQYFMGHNMISYICVYNHSDGMLRDLIISELNLYLKKLFLPKELSGWNLVLNILQKLSFYQKRITPQDLILEVSLFSSHLFNHSFI